MYFLITAGGCALKEWASVGRLSKDVGGKYWKVWPWENELGWKILMVWPPVTVVDYGRFDGHMRCHNVES